MGRGARGDLLRRVDMVVLDEINYAINYKMLDPEVVAEALRGRPEMVHVILTVAMRIHFW